MSETPLLAPLPLGDGPKRAHVKMRAAISSIARRVALKAMIDGRQDIFLEVYAAGIAHAVELLAKQRNDHAEPS